MAALTFTKMCILFHKKFGKTCKHLVLLSYFLMHSSFFEAILASLTSLASGRKASTRTIFHLTLFQI